SARSAARTNDVDTDQRRKTIYPGGRQNTRRSTGTTFIRSLTSIGASGRVCSGQAAEELAGPSEPLRRLSRYSGVGQPEDIAAVTAQ
uniref:hypothetical protein n=1 Tax=Pseudonocardia sp. TaxID=60912 RepID=UPI002635FA22